MNYLKKIHERRTKSGLEWPVLKALPVVLLAGTALAAVPGIAARIWPAEGTAAAVAKSIRTADILSAAIGMTLWTAVFTVAIGCIVVIVMKGPGYVADAYWGDEPSGGISE